MDKNTNQMLLVKNRHEAELLRLPNVVGVDVGYKYIDRKRTDAMAIRVFVREKRSELSDAERIPTSIEGIPTDVLDWKFDLAGPDPNRYAPLRGGCFGGGGGTLGAIVQDCVTMAPLILGTTHFSRSPHYYFQPYPGPVDEAIGQLYRSGYPTLDADVWSFTSTGISRGWINSVIDIGPTGGPVEPKHGMAVCKRGAISKLTT